MFSTAITMMRTQMARVQGAAEMYQAMNPQQTSGSSSTPSRRASVGTAPARTDAVNLSNEAQQSSSPYSNSGFGAARVTIQPNDNLEAILRKQGFSTSEIYAKNDQGSSLMDRVSSANNLRNPNLITSGSSLTIPQRGESQESSPSGGASGSWGVSNGASGSISAGTEGSVGGSVSASGTPRSSSSEGLFESLGRQADSGVQSVQDWGRRTDRELQQTSRRVQQWGSDVGNNIEAVDIMVNDGINSVSSSVGNWFTQNVSNPLSASFTDAQARARAND